MRKQIDLLAKIQKADLELERLKQQIAEAPRRIQARERKIEELEHNLAADRDRIEETRKLQRQYEREVEEGVERIKKSKSKLLTIKNNKEYQAVLKEIEETERANREKEDKILGCMEQMEGLEQVFRGKKRDLAGTRDEFEKEMETIQAEVDRAMGLVAEEERARDEMAHALDRKVLDVYELLRSSRGGTAVAQVEKATCSGCNMNIPPQMYNELQRGDSLKFCPNCERIIFWKDGNGVPE